MPSVEHADQDRKGLFARVGMIARWKPVHLGHQAILESLCRRSREVVIGIGSANRYNMRNPFTLEETLDMLKIALHGHENYILLPVDDLDDGPRWREMVIKILGNLDIFITDNPYVASLLKDVYPLAQPHTWVDAADRVPVDGSLVRQAMARGETWEHLVPGGIAAYIRDNRLDVRFRSEFGLQTLALETYLERRS